MITLPNITVVDGEHRSLHFEITTTTTSVPTTILCSSPDCTIQKWVVNDFQFSAFCTSSGIDGLALGLWRSVFSYFLSRRYANTGRLIMGNDFPKSFDTIKEGFEYARRGYESPSCSLPHGTISGPFPSKMDMAYAWWFRSDF